MYRTIIITLLVCAAFDGQGQEQSYKEVESKTHALFTAGKWKELVKIGEKSSLDYYYLNVRMGVAYYHLNHFYSAEIALKKALAQNNNDYTKKYLCWTYMMMGENVLSEQLYDQLSESSQKEVTLKKTFIEYLYLEGGVKKTSTTAVGNSQNIFAGLQHRLGNKLRITHSFNYFTQSTSQYDIKSSQYNVLGAYYFKSSAISAGGIFGKSVLTEKYQVSQTRPDATVDTQRVVGTVTSPFTFVYLNYTKKHKRLRFNLNMGYAFQQSTMDYSIGHSAAPPGAPANSTRQRVQKLDSVVDAAVFILSAGLNFTPKILGDRLSIGTDIYAVINSGSSAVIVKPTIGLRLSNKIWLNANYQTVENTIFADYTNNLIYTDTNLKSQRFSSTLNFLITPKLSSHITFVNENISDNYQNIDYGIKSIYVGLKLKL